MTQQQIQEINEQLYFEQVEKELEDEQDLLHSLEEEQEEMEVEDDNA